MKLHKNFSKSLPSTNEVSSVTFAAFRLPAGKLNPIFSSLSRNDRPPFFDFALQKINDSSFIIRCYNLKDTLRQRIWLHDERIIAISILLPQAKFHGDDNSSNQWSGFFLDRTNIENLVINLQF